MAGAAVLAGQGVTRVGFGAASVASSPVRGLDTIFDLASLTKPVTALTLARLERVGMLSRDEPLGALLPLAVGTPSGSTPIDLLLSHRAGLVAYNPFFEGLIRGERPALDHVLRTAAELRRPECVGSPPIEGFPAVYSDLGYLLVGAAIEARAEVPLDVLMAREVCLPLGLRLGSMRGLRAREPGVDALVAPTETVAWRGGEVRGAVHDENAWLVAGHGSAGHAGLFGDVAAVVRLGVAILEALAGRGDWLSSRELEPLVRPRPLGTHAAGFDRRSGALPASGSRFGAGTFGHLGFTGTSLWIDPDRQLAGVLLTNRVCPSRENWAIRQARPAAYDALFDAMFPAMFPGKIDAMFPAR
ncbi:MAG: class C beta-lactamase-related serine hydrolase [Myxococcales bacterium]|nr:class C beta-lactamase-related serine hydrolase [Myxococcales bacterium]